MHCLNKVLLAVLTLMPACTFEDGLPWAKANFEVNAAFSSEGRQIADRIKTSKDYEIRLDGLEVDLVAITLNTSTDGVISTFDPADPPQGYGLCHNGHCHADDGRLVDYAAIEAELAGAGVSGESVVQSIDRSVDLIQGGLVPLEDCLNDCEMGRGFLQTVDLRVGTVELRGRVFDTRADSRLPAEGVELRGLVKLDAVFSQAVKGEVGGSELPGISVTANLIISAPVFDVLDFAQLQIDDAVDLADYPEILPEFNEKLKNTEMFDVNISRHQL